MDLNQFYSGDDKIASFSEKGDAVRGVLVAEPELIDDKFNQGERVLVFSLDDDGAISKVYARRGQLRAIAVAVKASGSERLCAGDYLELAYVDDKVTGNSNPQKLWESVHQPAPIGVGVLGETGDDPFGSVA